MPSDSFTLMKPKTAAIQMTLQKNNTTNEL